MIVEAIFNMIIHLLTTFLDFVHVPALDPDLITVVNNTIDRIIGYAKPLINLFLPFNIAMILGSIVISIEGLYLVYSLVMWVLRKIPVASID